jgi:hypothetical protein
MATKPDSQSQIQKFRKAARDLGCEQDEKQFEEALRTVAKAKPPEKRREEKDGR